METFSTFSITSGHRAVNLQNENKKVVISFLPYVHLVKIHSFYINESITVVGSGTDDAVFGESSIQDNPEQDVAWVYTYTVETGIHPVGAIVKDDDGNPIYNEEDLKPLGLEVGTNVKLTKVYSTLEGLHTDKTVSEIAEEDRKFTIDLESWFAGAKPASVGLLLDASGSMIFTSDPLTPINIDDDDVNLTSEQKVKLLSKVLSTENFDSNPTNDVWEQQIFLTEEELSWILNTNNTDNNPLSDSGYNYFVFNKSPEVNEYAPLGYWDGSLGEDIYDSIIGYYAFDRGTYDDERRDWLKNSINGNEASVVWQINRSEFDEIEDISFTKADTPTEWSKDHRLSMKNGEGLTVKNLKLAEDVEKGLGVLLDVKPKSTDNFTISFSVQLAAGTETGSKTVPQNYTDLVYVGPLEDIKSSDYYRVIRDGCNTGSVAGGESNSKNRLKGYQNDVIGSNQVTNINTVFDTHEHIITLVFNKGTVTSYYDGTMIDDQSSLTLTDNYIVITGFDNDYDGSDIYIDNVCVFDTALSSSDVKTISSTDNTIKDEYLAYNTYGEHKEKIAIAKGFFVEAMKGGMSGWYYINHDSQWTEHYFKENIETAKTLWGVYGTGKDTVTYYDDFKTPNGVEASPANTKYSYTPKKNSPSLFYLDENGNLCCFFTRGTHQDQTGTSFVYKKDDKEYIKVEALQRAIGSFASKLDEASPNSQVSAVRYNLDTATADDYDKFVLLDWTTDPSAIQRMLSLNYGTGGTRTGTLSNPASQNTSGILQYNYGITGGTTTYVGFKAFNDVLKDRINPDSDKFLIVFTDGKDTSEDQQDEIITMADQLRKEGYTIMAVMLAGGTIEFDTEETSEYQTTKDFILKFVGPPIQEGDEELTKEEKQQYFFSTEELGSLEDENLSSIDRLTEIFTNDLLERISDNLHSYSIKDYIDPRFNLISSSNKEYNLDAKGIVTILNPDGSTYAVCDLINGLTLNAQDGVTLKPVEDTSSGNYYISIRLSTDIDVDATTARLFFDKANNMYFLKWVDQTIPGCVPNVNKLSVWNARFTIKAKDDFIGGNAVLTNGNEENMNMVYSEEDDAPSSGIADWLREEDTDELLSKGFPRVTVNVPPPVFETSDSEIIYMGENLNYETIKENMLDQAKKDKDNRNIFYWEYLERYGKKYGAITGKTANDYIQQLLSEGTVKIPYYYLPNTSNTNLTSDENHEADELGNLVYSIIPPEQDGGEIQDLTKRQFILTVTYEPKTVDERQSSNDTLVKDGYYNWSPAYKPTAGKVQDQKVVITNTHDISIVSGEIALQVVFDSQLVEIIDGQEIEYDIELNRNYKGVTEKVGTFKATYDGTSEIHTDINGNYILTANLDYSIPYMQQYGLPLGTYTLGKPTLVISPSYIKFDQINIVDDTNRYIVENLFNLGTNHDTPLDYLAVFKDNTQIILGADESGDDYLEDRFGIFEVKPIAAFEMPVSGSNSLIIFNVIAVICILTAIVLEPHKKIRNKKRK